MFKKKGVIFGAVIAILLCCWIIFYYNNFFSRHIVIATLISIDAENDNLVFKTKLGDELNVKSPNILIPLLVKNKTYYISIYSNNLRKPFLKEIKEVSD